MISYNDFEKIDIRTGTIISARECPQAKKSAYQLVIDFGPLGKKVSSAQITKYYSPENLIGKQIVAVLNFPPKQIANFISECLVLGVTDDEGGVILLEPDKKTNNGRPVS
jgi:tRNA-binding protein